MVIGWRIDCDAYQHLDFIHQRTKVEQKNRMDVEEKPKGR